MQSRERSWSTWIENIENLANREILDVVAGSGDHGDRRILGRPECGISRAKKQDAGKSTGSGQVADAAVVTQESGATLGQSLKSRNECGQGGLVPEIEGKAGMAEVLQRVEQAAFLFRFTRHDDEV